MGLSVQPETSVTLMHQQCGQFVADRLSEFADVGHELDMAKEGLEHQ